MKKQILAFLLLASLSLGILLSGCSQTEEPAEGEAFAMSTYISQKVYGPGKEQAVKAVDDLLFSLEAKLSLFKEDSDIGRINQNAGISPVKVDDYTFDLIKAAKKYCELSQGTFDITIAPITLLWGIDTDHARVPSEEEINACLPLVGWEKVLLDEREQTVFLEEKGMSIDLGGVAKGYIANRIREEYEKQGVTSALVSIGGNVDVFGLKPDGSPYSLGIRDPASVTGTRIVGSITVTDRVVATSGGYERYLEQDGKRYHHILDPKTGYPAETDLLSVSVISKDGGLSDFLSTTLFIAGKEHIRDYIHNTDFDTIVIDKDNKVYLSDGIKDSFQLTNQDYSLAEEIP